MQNIKAKKGETISLQGKKYRLNKTISLSVTPERLTDTVVAPQQEVAPEQEVITAPAAPEVQGEAKSDPAQGIDKGTVLGLIQKQIDQLEKHENTLLMEGVFDDLDDLDLVDQQRGEPYKTANYAAATVHIMDLKSLYKKVKNLS
jgi:hypothetical protein